MAKYYYAPGVHEPGPAGALTINAKAFDSLPRDLQAIIQRAAGDEALRMLAEMAMGNGEALGVLLDRHGVDLRRFPAEVYGAMLAASADVVAESAGKSEISGRIYASWSAFRAKAVALAPLTELGYMGLRGG